MYKVIKDFADLQDNNHVYRKGDSFPREGVDVGEARIAELSTTANKRGEILIAEVAEETAADANKSSKDRKPKEDKNNAKKANKKER